jgi:nitrite reductase (NADH) small subunit
MAWQKVADLAEIPALGSRVLNTEDYGAIAIFRTRDEQVFAMRDSCPHKRGKLSQGIVHGCKVTCPLHSWVIELQSGDAVAPDVGRVKTFNVKVEEESIYLDL